MGGDIARRLVELVESTPAADSPEIVNLLQSTFIQSQAAVKVLADSCPHIVLSINPSGSHAKVVMIDEKVALVSSFNFLAIGGVPSQEGNLSGELGIIINSPSLTRNLQRLSIFSRENVAMFRGL